MGPVAGTWRLRRSTIKVGRRVGGLCATNSSSTGDDEYQRIYEFYFCICLYLINNIVLPLNLTF